MEYMLGLVCAIITSNISAIFGKKGSNNTSPSPTDFMPKWGVFEDELYQDERPIQSVEDMKRILLAMARAQNSKKNIGERRRNNRC